jgi:hypothetical protein
VRNLHARPTPRLRILSRFCQLEVGTRTVGKNYMARQPFVRAEHVYKNDAFTELVKDAIRFFNGTPVHQLPMTDRFSGCGIYALYYTGPNAIYARLAELNRLSYSVPIYVGKAVPRGWRQSRVSDSPLNQDNELQSRIREHIRNIAVGEGLEVDDFACRFVIFESDGSDMIGTVEAALIKAFRPVWNSALDGFGNHTPGEGRFDQAKSDWDVIHHGRVWAERCRGTPKERGVVLKNVEAHFKRHHP